MPMHNAGSFAFIRIIFGELIVSIACDCERVYFNIRCCVLCIHKYRQIPTYVHNKEYKLTTLGTIVHPPLHLPTLYPKAELLLFQESREGNTIKNMFLEVMK
jgi:hypothetical protein